MGYRAGNLSHARFRGIAMPTPTPTRRIILIGLVSLAIAMGIGRFAFTPLLPLMRDDGLVSLGDGGVLASVHFLGYLLGALFAASIPWSPRTSLRLGLITIGLCTLAMGMTDSFAAWLVLRWLSGVCGAFTLVLVGNYYVRHLADIGRAELQGWVFSGVGIGIVVVGLGALAIMVSGIDSSARSALTVLMAVARPSGDADTSSMTSSSAPCSW